MTLTQQPVRQRSLQKFPPALPIFGLAPIQPKDGISESCETGEGCLRETESAIWMWFHNHHLKLPE